MKTILVIILVAAVIAGAIWVATKYFGLFSDKDKDGIPDKVEDAVDEVKTRAKRVKEELKDVVDSAKDVVAQSKDVVDAAKGGTRKGRKPRRTSNTKGGTATGGAENYYDKKR
jgi:hypothetical protein